MNTEVVRIRPHTILRVPRPRFPLMGGAATPESLIETLDNLYSTTWQLMNKEVVDNIFGSTPLWYWMSSRNRVRRTKGSRWIGVPLMYGKNATVGSVGRGGQVPITETNIETTGKYDWKNVAGSVVRYRQDDQQNTGASEIRDLALDKIKNLELSLIDQLEVQSFGDGSGNDGKDILGLRAIVKSDPTTNPATPPGNIGGIDAATNTWWRNKQRTWDTMGLLSGDTDIAFNLRKLYNLCSKSNDHPTLLLTEVTQYERYEASLLGKLQVYDVSEFGDLGFQALRFKGSALTFGDSCPAGTLYELNERYLLLYIDQAADFDMTEWKGIPDQFDRVAQVIVTCQFTTNNRRMQGVLTGMPS